MATNTARKKLELPAQKREVFGKKLRKVRIEGNIPGNIYGPQFKSLAVSVNVKDFNRTFKVAKETGIIYLKVDKEEHPVLIKHIQYHPVSHIILHIDLRKVDLKQKIETEVPVKIVGESPAVAQKGGVLLTQLDHILVEALPADIPHEIAVDISPLVEIGQEIKVADLPKSTNYTVKEEPEKLVVSIIAHKEESLVAETTTVAPEITEEKPVEEGGEEGAAPAAEGKEDKGKKEPTEAKGKEDQKPAEKAPESKDAKKEEKK